MAWHHLEPRKRRTADLPLHFCIIFQSMMHDHPPWSLSSILHHWSWSLLNLTWGWGCISTINKRSSTSSTTLMYLAPAFFFCIILLDSAASTTHPTTSQQQHLLVMILTKIVSNSSLSCLLFKNPVYCVVPLISSLLDINYYYYFYGTVLVERDKNNRN